MADGDFQDTYTSDSDDEFEPTTSIATRLPTQPAYHTSYHLDIYIKQYSADKVANIRPQLTVACHRTISSRQWSLSTQEQTRMSTSSKKRAYSDSELQAAVSAVKRTKVSISKIAQDFGIPRKTLSDHANGNRTRSTLGPSRMVSVEDETALVSYIKYIGRQGFPMTREILKKYVSAMVKLHHSPTTPTLFNLDKGPSDEWCRKFFGRHPELTERKPEKLDRGRARMSNHTVMDQYFALLSGEVQRLGLEGRPSQIYNCDETGWSGKESSKVKVIGVKGAHTYQQAVTSAGHITAHLCISADGRVLPTFLIFERCLPHTTYKDGVPGNWMFGYSESGYMDSELFYSWFKNLFIPSCGRARPVLLVMDNHDSHISLDVVKLAMENDITLLGLPPHTTHILQPLDVSINGPLKAKFQSLAVSLGFIHKQQVLNKTKFPVVLSHAIDQQLSSARVKDAFRKSGMYPVSKEAIDQTQIAPSHIRADEVPSRATALPTPSTSAAAAVSPTEACPTCGGITGGNPLVKEGLIPEHLAQLFQAVPGKPQPAQRGSSKLVTKARVITTAEFYQQLDDKAKETARRKIALEDRKQQRLQRKEAKAKVSPKVPTKVPAEVQRPALQLLDVCQLCHLLEPPSTDGTDIDWIECDLCEDWFHQACVGIHVGEGVDDSYYICDPCSSTA